MIHPALSTDAAFRQPSFNQDSAANAGLRNQQCVSMFCQRAVFHVEGLKVMSYLGGLAVCLKWDSQMTRYKHQWFSQSFILLACFGRACYSKMPQLRSLVFQILRPEINFCCAKKFQARQCNGCWGEPNKLLSYSSLSHRTWVLCKDVKKAITALLQLECGHTITTLHIDGGSNEFQIRGRGGPATLLDWFQHPPS